MKSNLNKRADDKGELASICFLMPYFGSWPFWFPLYLASCRANPTINWIFFTDCGTPADCPPNVEIVSVTYADYCARVSSALDIDFHPEKPYKICDIRPAFGLIHQNELKAYDFWAFGDIDLVYGDLRRYFTSDRLDRKDLLAAHSRRISGHCCLIRNNSTLREAFRLIPNWKQLFTASKHYAVDEGAFSRIFLRHKNWPAWLARLASILAPLRRNAEFVEAFSTPNARIPWTDGSKNFPNFWFWRNGHLTNDIDGDREFPYFHFLIWKRVWANQNHEGDNPVLKKLVEDGAWKISEDGFSAIPSAASEAKHE